MLRGDAAKFVLSAFNLDICSDQPTSSNPTTEEIEQHITHRLAAFLQTESSLRIAVRHDDDADRVIQHPEVSYTLRFEPWVVGPRRFIRPDAWADEHPAPYNIFGTSPLFQFVCRVNSERIADLWVRVNHVGIDGVATQEMLSRLEHVWGIRTPVVFPSRDEFEPYTTARPSPGRAGIVEVQTFLDFGRLLAWRKRQNEKLAEPMTFSAAMLWWLARHERFSRLYLGTTVEIPEVDGLGRGVGVVVVRPGDYFDRADGLGRYVQDFNRQLELTRQRKSEGCKTLDAAAYLPAKLEEHVLHHALEGGRAFGSLALTVLKDARVFGAPLADAGHADGFIAVGCVSCETADGKRAGCVIVKGPEERISDYATVLRDAMDRVRDESAG